MTKAIIPQEIIENRIFLIRGQKVMIDRDLAELYGVETKALNRQVNNNIDRFPSDFMFRLKKEEFNEILRCKNYTSSWGGRRFLPLVFTEQGVAMLSGVLRSKRAVLMNVAIMRAFVRLRKVLSTHKELAGKLKELEYRVGDHDGQIKKIFEAINELMELPDRTVKNVGFLK